jgi:isopentenyldiphosphate isomerase
MIHPPVVIVDEHDVVTGSALLREAWAKGLYYRTILIMIEDGKGSVLLQKRAETMELFPGCWDTSAGGHVDEGQDYESAARVEIAEELGLIDPPLHAMGRMFVEKSYQGRLMRHFSVLYRLVLPNAMLQSTSHEVAGLQWFGIAEAKRMVVERPNSLSDVLKEVLTRYY